MKLTLCCPCYLKPQRTIRAIESVLAQDINGWEALFIGDNCPKFEENMESGVFQAYSREAEKNGNEMNFANMREHKGGWGYAGRNVSIDLARGEYIVFLDNDDVILSNHFRNYLSEIENTDFDMVYFDSYIEPIKSKRVSELRFGMIGHSEIIVKTELLKNYKQTSEYGHDWTMIQHLLRKDIKVKKSTNDPTYIVKEIGGGHGNRERLTEKEID